MDYEKKLALAKEALDSGSYDKETIEYIFPELKESEGERIRKSIINLVEHGFALRSDCHRFFDDYSKEQMVSWLEKHGEQKSQGKSALEAAKEEKIDNQNCIKPTDKVEPKFKIGDTIIKKHNSDILYFGSFTITDITGGKYWYNDRIICDITKQDEWELVEQKPAWSEEDKNRINRLIAYFEDKESFTAEDDVVYTNWLKSLKDRVLPQPKQEWSNKDNDMFQAVLLRVNNFCGNGSSDIKTFEILNWLTCLKYRCIYQSKEKISENDIEHIDSLLERLKGMCNKDATFVATQFSVNEDIDWLKSLRPQKTWKPSEEQLKSLKEVIDVGHFTSYPNALEILYEQLKKLREE